MVFTRFVSALAGILAIAAPAVAQEFGDDYAVVGQFDLAIGEDTATLYSLDILPENRPGIERHEVMGQVFFNIGGYAESDGKPAKPQIEVQIGPGTFPPKTISSVTLLMDGAMFLSDADVGGSATISNVVWGDDGSLSFDFASLVRSARYGADGAFEPVAPDLPLLEVEGHFTGMVAPK